MTKDFFVKQSIF